MQTDRKIKEMIHLAILECRIDERQFSLYNAGDSLTKYRKEIGLECKRLTDTAKWLRENCGVSATLSLKHLGNVVVYSNGTWEKK